MNTEWIPLSSLSLGQQEIGYASEALHMGWISGTGPYVAEFERAVAERVHRSYALAVANGTVAIEAVLRAMGIGPGDEVIVPALTFVAPAAMVATVGALPVFADVTPESWTLDPAEVAAQITPRTKAIIAVDLLGHPCDYDALSEVARDIPIIEDAAEAHGALYKGQPVGAFGVASTFSFHANKAVSTGEGGCVLTDSAQLIDLARLYTNHGMTKERPYYHEVVGHNFRMTNVTAAIGLGQVQRWDELTGARNRVAARYDELLEDTPGIYRRPVASWARESCWLYAVGVEDGRRAFVLQALQEAKIDSRAIWTALPDLRPYRDGVRGEYPVARRLSQEVIWLPTYAIMAEQQIQRVAKTLAWVLRQ